MKTKLGLLAVALVAVAAWHWPSFTPTVAPKDVDDVRGIMAGYHATPNLTAGVASWFTGTWINHAADGAFRPIAAVWHYAQVAVIEAGYPVVVTAASLILFAVVCALSGLLARRWSNDAGGYIAAVVVAAMPSNHNFIPGDVFSWWPVDDNTLALLFGLVSLLCFDSWLASPRLRYAVATVGFMVLSCLSKEWGYILPVMLMVLTVYHRTPASVARLRLVAFAFAVVVALVAWRRIILPESRDMLAVNWWAMNGLCADYWRGGILGGLILATDQWRWILVSSLPVLSLAAIYPLSCTALPKRETAAALLCALALIPISGSEIFNHRLLFPWVFGAIAGTCAVICVLEKCKETASRWSRRDASHSHGHVSPVRRTTPRPTHSDI